MATITTPNDLLNLLKARRLELGESQSQFAKRIRKNQAWVSDFERSVTPNIYVGTMLEVIALAGFDLAATPRDARPTFDVGDEEGDLAPGFGDPEAEGMAP